MTKDEIEEEKIRKELSEKPIPKVVGVSHPKRKRYNIDEEEVQKKFIDMSSDGKTIRSYLDGTDGLNFMCKCGSWLKLSGTVYENKQINLTFKCDKCGHEERRKVAVDLTIAYDYWEKRAQDMLEYVEEHTTDSLLKQPFKIENDDDYNKLVDQIKMMKKIGDELRQHENALLHPIKMLEKEITTHFGPVEQKNDMLVAEQKKALSEYKIKKDKELEKEKGEIYEKS